jgi:benzodiazapine receptor
MTRGRSIAGLVVCLAACFGAAAVGSLFTGASVSEWYPTLQRPSWTPPPWIFGPVWTLLYALMAVAAWLVWRKGGWAGARAALALFAGQLALNAVWSPLFFGLHSPGIAMLDLALLWIAIVATTAAFWRHSRAAAGLMAPYLAWSTFAAALNFAIWRMNS